MLTTGKYRKRASKRVILSIGSRLKGMHSIAWFRAGIVNLAARGMLVVSVARRLGSEGPLLAYCAACSNRAGPQKGALGPLS
jgi:hypothetical protein